MSTLEVVWAQPVAQALGSALAGFVWQGAAIALAVRALLACMGRRTARERYAVACFGMLVMAALPVGSFWYVLAGTAAKASPSPVALGDGVLIAASGAALTTWFSVWLEALRPWLLSAWLCGVLFFSLRTLFAWRQALALTRQGTRHPGGTSLQALARMLARTRVSRPVRLLESVAVEVPTVVGMWRPVILVPASALSGLSVLQLEAVLAHELAHIRQHDYLVNLLQALVETALFYHPAVWWLSARIREEREHYADDVAVESCGDVWLYSRALAALEQLRVSVPVPAVAANGGSLLLRLQRLLAMPQGGVPLHPWRFVGSLAAALLVVVLGAARQAQATEPASQPPAQEQLGRPATSEPIRSFQVGMTRPEKLSGDVPRIPASMLPPLAPPGSYPFDIALSVKCTIAVEGTLTDCEVIEPKPKLAELHAEVLRALATSRYKPVTDQGRPIPVTYIFNLRIASPK